MTVRILTSDEVDEISKKSVDDLYPEFMSGEELDNLIFTLRESQSARIGWMEQALGGGDLIHGLTGQLDDAYKEIMKHWKAFDSLGCHCRFCGEQQVLGKKYHKDGCIVLCANI